MTTAFLVIALFFPRIALLGFYLFGAMPPNDTPLALDVVAAIVSPRLLIAWWTYTNGEHPLWTVLFVVAWVAASFGASGNGSRREAPRRPARARS